MGNFLAFALRHLVASIAIVIGLALAVFGYVQQGLEIYAYGVKPWMFQLAGFLLFVGVIIHLVYQWDQKILALSNANEGPSGKAANPERSAIRTLEASLQNGKFQLTFGTNPRDFGPAIVDLRSSLLTGQKVFGIEIPEITDGKEGVQLSVDFLNEVIPYLKKGHVPEAKERATAFLARL